MTIIQNKCYFEEGGHKDKVFPLGLIQTGVSENFACVVCQEEMVGTKEGSREYKQIVNLTNLLKQKSSAIAFSFA